MASKKVILNAPPFLKTEIFFLVHNYINWYLTGGIAVMEPGDTSGTALWNPITQTWSEKVVSCISPDLLLKLPIAVLYIPMCKSLGIYDINFKQ